MQDGVTPERWIGKWGGWLVRPDRSETPEALLHEIVSGTQSIAALWGAPVDLEWAYDGSTLYWLQARPITSGADITVYSNRIAREVLPGMIKPLVWSVNVPLVNGAWVRLFTELIGPNDIDPQELAKAFHYRAYFNMSTIGRIFEQLGMPHDSLELLLGIEVPGGVKPSFKPSAGVLLRVPRMMAFIARKWRFGKQVARFLPDATQRFQAFQRTDLATLTPVALLAAVDRLYALAQEAAYYNIVTPLLLHLYSRGMAAQLARAGVDAAQYDLTRDIPALQALNPNRDLQELHTEWAQLPSALQQQVLTVTEQTSLPPEAASFMAAVAAFLQRFGHFSDSGNDFSALPWRENRPLVMRMIASGREAPATGGAPSLDAAPLTRLQRVLLTPLYRRVRAFRLYREQISSLYTFGYGLFRDYFLVLGACLMRTGHLTVADDIFYLTLEEVRQAAGDVLAAPAARAAVARRRREMAAAEGVILPAIICGDTAPPIAPEVAHHLYGAPSSRGYYRGPARVIRGLHESERLQSGDVLVIPFSDVGWTPLFRKAGAVIAEAGGLLSHSSIIAREYGIPAVVSVPHACQIADGASVTVDGYSGKILIHDEREN